MGLGQSGRKDLTGLPDRSMMGATTLPSLPTMECKVRGHIVIPYTQVFVKVSKGICGRYGIQTSLQGWQKPSKTFWSPLRTRTLCSTKSGAIYRYNVTTLGCDDEYIGETSRTFGERYKEHLKAPSAIHHHSILTGHTTNHNNFQIIGREGAQSS